jgi:hypothetical protein
MCSCALPDAAVMAWGMHAVAVVSVWRWPRCAALHCSADRVARNAAGWLPFGACCFLCSDMDKHDQTACSACLPGLFQAQKYSTHCELCAVGHFSNRSDGNDQCLQCDAGLFQDSPKRSECKQCAAGFFASDKGRNSCTDCDDRGDYFQERTGATLCEPCPTNSRRYVGAGQGSGSNRTSCKCQRNFWRHDGLSGKACFPCPTGGICDGKTELPYPDEGYWAMSEIQQNSTSSRLKILNPPGVDPPNACPEATICQADPALFWQCEFGHCKGGANFECEER